MRTSERLTMLKRWAEAELCAGRQYKAPSADMDITKLTMTEPRCFVGWVPTRPDHTGALQIDPINICPGILIMPKSGYAKYTEEKRFDRYNRIYRPQELGQSLCVDMLFCIYEPGIRMPGFADAVEKGPGEWMKLLKEGTEQGLYTLLDWMDDGVTKLLEQQHIPGTDLFLEESTLTYSLYSDQNFVVDKRPLYYGFISAEFRGYADEGQNSTINELLN